MIRNTSGGALGAVSWGPWRRGIMASMTCF
jgi:hypothetical protein